MKPKNANVFFKNVASINY